MNGVEPNVPSMIVECEAGPVSLHTVEKRRHWSVRDVGEQERKLP